MKTKIVVAIAVVIAILVLWGGCQMIADDEVEKAPVATQGTKQVDSGVVVKEAPAQCQCPKKPKKPKGSRRQGKSKPLAVAKPKLASTPAPVAQALRPVAPVAKQVVVTHGDDHMLDKVDTGWARRMAAKPKEEPVVNVVREVVVIQQPAKFYPAVPSNYNTCQFLYGSYRCDNPSYGYTRGTSYVQPYAPQPHQPVVVQRYVSAPAISTAPTAAPAITTAPQTIATR